MPWHLDGNRHDHARTHLQTAKTAMQSGTANAKEWVLDYEPEQPRDRAADGLDPSGDMRQHSGCGSIPPRRRSPIAAPRHRLSGFQEKPAARRTCPIPTILPFKRRDAWTH
jgi:hypothetical protein